MVHEYEPHHRYLEGHPDRPEGEDVDRNRIAASPEVVTVVGQDCDGEHDRSDAEDSVVLAVDH